MNDLAFLYGFFGTNVGDGAVTQGAVSLAKQAGAGQGGTVVSQMNTAARKAWMQTLERYPDLQLFEKTIPLEKGSYDDPAEYLAATLSTPGAQWQVLESYGIENAGCIVYTGGEHLFSLGRAQDDWNILARLLPVLAAIRQGRRIVFLPTTFGPLHSDFSKVIVKEVLEYVDFVSVRDGRSNDLFREMGLSTPPALLDPAFFLESDRPFEALPQKIDRKLVSIVMRLDGFGLRAGPEASRQRIETLEAEGYSASAAYSLYRDIGRQLLRSGCDLRIFIQCFADDRPARLLAEDLGMEFPGRRILINKPANAQNMIHDLATGAATVTSRFHAAIFSLLSGCPPIGIYFKEHGHKTPGLFEMVGRGDTCFDGHETSAQTISAATVAAIDAGQVLHDDLLARVKQMQRATLDAYRDRFVRRR